MPSLQDLIERAVPARPGALDRLSRARRRRATRRRLGTGVLALTLAFGGTTLAFRALLPTLDHEAPRPGDATIGDVTTYRIEHPPQSIAAGGEAGWVLARQTHGQWGNTLYRLDAATNAIDEVEMAGWNPEDVAVIGDHIWVVACDADAPYRHGDCDQGRASLLRLHPSSAEVLAARRVPGWGHTLFAGGGYGWIDAVIDSETAPSRRVLFRIDPATGERVLRDCCEDDDGYAFAYGAGWLWGSSFGGETLQIDPATMRTHRTYRRLCAFAATEESVLASRCVDGRGVVGFLDPISGDLRPTLARFRYQEPFMSGAGILAATGATGWEVRQEDGFALLRKIEPDGRVGEPQRVRLGASRFFAWGLGSDPFSVAADPSAVWISDYRSGNVVRVAVEGTT